MDRACGALAGLDVVLNDVSVEPLNSGMATITAICRARVQEINHRRMPQNRRWSGSYSAEAMDGLADCEMVIETAVEKEEVKRRFFTMSGVRSRRPLLLPTPPHLDHGCRIHRPPERFIGIHFMKSGTLMNCRTDPRHRHRRRDLRRRQRKFVTRLGKHIGYRKISGLSLTAFCCRDHEAIYTLYEGVGNVEAIDRCDGSSGAHHPMGPLELPISSVSTASRSCRWRMRVWRTPSTRRALLVKYVEAGWLAARPSAASTISRRQADPDALTRLSCVGGLKRAHRLVAPHGPAGL